MSNTLQVNISQKTNATTGQATYEGVVQIPGLSKAKLQNNAGVSQFPSRSALTTVARGLGRRLDMEVEYQEPQRRLPRSR